MIDIQMSNDIRKFEPKMIGPLTKRQTLCFVIAAVIGAPLAFVLPLTWGNRLLVVGLVCLPIIMCGYIKMDGSYFEVIALRMLYRTVLTPPKRKQVRQNTFREGLKQMEERKKKRRLAKMTEAQRRRYLRQEQQKKKVVYSNKKRYKVYR